MTRAKLPARRANATFKFKVADAHGFTAYHATVGYFDGAMTRPGEVFMSTAKSGQQMQTLMRDNAICLSIALQHGAPLDEIRAAITRGDQGEALGPIGVLLDLLERNADREVLCGE